MPKLTKRVVDAIEPGSTERVVWDSELRGFGVRVKPTGLLTFLVQYRNAASRSRRHTLGRYGVITPDEARKLAQQALARAANGQDPAAERKEFRAAPTVSDLLDRYLSDHVDIHNAETTRKEVRRLVETRIRPRLGALRVVAVTRQDIIRFHTSMREAQRQANLAVAILSKAFSLAEVWGLRPEHSNPCRKVAHFPETSRERFLSAEELGRLGTTLRLAEVEGLPWKVDLAAAKAKHVPKLRRSTPVSGDALLVIRLLLFTGARLSETLHLKRDHVDLERSMLALPGRKGGGRSWHPIGNTARDILADHLGAEESNPKNNASKKRDGDWLFPAPRNKEKPLSKEVLEHAWQRIRAHADIPDVRLHDLRHTVGTYASQTGVNAFVVRDLLRHRTLAMTGRYANFDADPVRQVSDAVGDRIRNALGGA